MTCVCWMPWGPENFFYQHIYFISKPLTHTFLYCFWNVLWAKFLQKFFDVKIFRYFSQTATRINESTSASRWHYSNYTGKGCYELKVFSTKFLNVNIFRHFSQKARVCLTLASLGLHWKKMDCVEICVIWQLLCPKPMFYSKLSNFPPWNIPPHFHFMTIYLL